MGTMGSMRSRGSRRMQNTSSRGSRVLGVVEVVGVLISKARGHISSYLPSLILLSTSPSFFLS